MRLHQRVGRLNRIGQRDIVKVMLFQNPDTVESRIWALLNVKLDRIRHSINAVTEELEDLHQLVLGIAGPGMLDTVFSQADAVPREKLAEWFDQKTGQIGGEDAVRVVHDLLGHAQHFDFSQTSERVPKLDLPHLAAFFRLALRQNRRQVTDKAGLLSFATPISWQGKAGVRHRYDDAHFDRKAPSAKKGTILGVGSRIFDVALDQACHLPDVYASLTQDPDKRTLLVFRCFDRVTGNAAQPKAIISGAVRDAEGFQILKDWQVLLMLNELANIVKPPAEADPAPNAVTPGDCEVLSQAEALMRENFPSLDLPFRQPDLELLGIVAGIEQSTKARRTR